MKLDFLTGGAGGGGGNGGRSADLWKKFNLFHEPPGPRPLDDARRVVR